MVTLPSPSTPGSSACASAACAEPASRKKRVSFASHRIESGKKEVCAVNIVRTFAVPAHEAHLDNATSCQLGEAFGLRQSSGAFEGLPRPKAPEDWRSPKASPSWQLVAEPLSQGHRRCYMVPLQRPMTINLWARLNCCKKGVFFLCF